MTLAEKLCRILFRRAFISGMEMNIVNTILFSHNFDLPFMFTNLKTKLLYFQGFPLLF